MNAIEIKGLSKSYPGFLLDNLNFTLPRGCIMGLIGKNGAGKSTTIKLILDMLHKDNGSITILGKDNKRELRDTKEDIGVVLDEVCFPECLTAKQVNNIMKHTYKNWDETIYFDYLNRLSVPADKEFKDFSRGMRMKLGIAVALSHSPKLLILDEATSGLDPVVRDEVMDMFNEFTREESHAILISSHIVSDLEKICDYIVFLHNGKLLLCEEKDLLLDQYGVLHCTASQLEEVDSDGIIGKRESAYGIEAVVRREAVPREMKLSPVTIEELFLFIVKEGL